MNRKLVLIACIAAPLLLTGCNERIQAEIEAGKTERAKIAATRDEKIAELREWNKKRMAEQEQDHKRKTQERFHAFAGPLFRFIAVVAGIFGSVSLFQWLAARIAHHRDTAFE